MQTLNILQGFEAFLNFYGRHRKTDQGYAFYYTGSGFTFSVTGTYINLVFLSSYDEEEKKPYVVMTINDKIETIALPKGYHVVKRLISKDSHVSILKRSESLMSRTEIISLETDGFFHEKLFKDKPVKLHFIGDSLTCGYGNLSHDVDLAFSTEYEDGLQSYAYLTSTMLNAETEIVAVSGIGIYKSIYASVSMPYIYEQYDIYDRTPYPFLKRFDVIILNLGTNDNTYLKILVEPTRHYESGQLLDTYKHFIKRLKDIHQDTNIIVISQGSRQEFVDQIIEKAVLDLNDNHVFHLRLSDILDSDGMGQQYHPTIKTHQRWSMELKTFIETIRK